MEFPRLRAAPLRWRLSLIVSALLSMVVIAFGGLAFQEVETALLRAGRSRLEAVADQLAGLLVQSSRQRLEEAKRIAALPEVTRFLKDSDPAVRERALKAIRAATGQQPVWITVWTRDGSKVLELAPHPRPDQPNLRRAFRNAPKGTGISDLKVSESTTYYDAAAEIGQEAGYLVASRAFSSAAAAQLITQLIGGSAKVHVGNRADNTWTDLAKLASKPPIDVTARATFEYSGAEGRRIAAAAPVRETPWAVVVEFPRSAVVEPARAFLFRLAALALPFVVVAALFTRWLMGRVATPIQDLTEAAERIAAGRYTHRVQTGRDDEIGRLGAAFNTMTATVEEGIHRLEARVRERTEELEVAIAALREAQEEAVRREKLAMLGQLASGVGHELRNPLGVMTNAVYYLEMIQEQADPEVREYLGIVRGQIGVADRIVTDLLDFARIKPPHTRETALGALVDEQLRRLGPVPDSIQVHRDFPPDLPPVRVDPGQVGQVVLNLLTNAIQAMESGGTLTLRGRMAPDGVCLDVNDTGTGIPPELQEKIFEPLFTTRARGIGLGLAVSRSLTEANEGRLEVESRVGAGTTFSLTMAAAAGVPV